MHGTVEVLGFILTASPKGYRIVSPSTDALLSIKNPFDGIAELCISDLFDGLELFRDDRGEQVLGLPSNCTSSVIIDPPGNFSRLIIPESWKAAAKEIAHYPLHTRKPPCLIICGPRKRGKSTTCRFLLNSMLNSYPQIAHLDLDPGQTEFIPPGFLSLKICQNPIFEPPFAHSGKVDHAKHFGFTSMDLSPKHYYRCVYSLFETYRREYFVKGIPLVINTMGWISGLGLEMLKAIVRMIKPSHLAYLNDYGNNDIPDKVLFEPLLDLPVNTKPLDPREGVLVLSLECGNPTQIADSRIGGSAALKRNLIIESYFSGNWNLESGLRFDLSPLEGKCPFRIPWANALIYSGCPGERISEANAGFLQTIASMTNCIVGITLMVDDSSLYEYESECPVNIDGAGLIRAVDPISKVIDIITPIPPNFLVQARYVSIRHSPELRRPGKTRLPEFISGEVPYYSAFSTFSTCPETTRVRKVRTNLKRHWD